MRDEGNIFVSVSSKTARRERNRTSQRVEFFEIVRFTEREGEGKTGAPAQRSLNAEKSAEFEMHVVLVDDLFHAVRRLFIREQVMDQIHFAQIDHRVAAKF